MSAVARTRRLVILFLAATVVPALGLLVAAGARAAYEQTAWQPQGEGRIWVTSTGYSPHGIILTVEAKAGVTEVWRSCQNLWAWRPQHQPVDFHRAARGETTFEVLVDYKFSPGNEWLLALKSGDGHWMSMSPYFPDNWNVSAADWEERLSRAEHIAAPPR